MTRSLARIVTLALALLSLPACKGSGDGSGADAGPKLTPLSLDEQRRVDAVAPAKGLVDAVLADALIDLPRDHAGTVLRRAYPDAAVLKDNPRVNQVWAVLGDAKPATVDIRWSRVSKDRIGMVVLGFRRGTSVKALSEAVRAVGAPTEGEANSYSTAGGRLRMTFYDRNMEGETTVSFESGRLEGDPISRPDDQMKQAEQWQLNGKQRRLAPAADAGPGAAAPAEPAEPGKQAEPGKP